MTQSYSNRAALALHHKNYLADVSALSIADVQTRLDDVAATIAGELTLNDIEAWMMARAAKEKIPGLVLSVCEREWDTGFFWSASVRNSGTFSSTGATPDIAIEEYRKKHAEAPARKRAEIAKLQAEIAAMEAGK